MSLTRRSLFLAGAGAAAVVGGLEFSRIPALAKDQPGLPYRVNTLTGPEQTGRFGAAWTDLGIPVRCPNGSLLYIGGDTYDGGYMGEGDWRCPVGLRSGRPDGVIDGSVGGGHARSLVPEGHAGGTTAIPSDIFRIGDKLYLHLMRGRLHETHHTDFWESSDNGETWTYLCQWPGEMLRGAFQQKAYAVAEDGWCYVLSSRFSRGIPSELLLHRVRHEQVGDPAAYEPWGHDGTSWDWGRPATTVAPVQPWGEICFRAMDGAYAFSWFHCPDNSIRVQRLDRPTSNLFTTPQKTLIVNCPASMQGENRVTSPYGGFIMPGSTFADFTFLVSQWNNAIRSYRIFTYRAHNI